MIESEIEYLSKSVYELPGIFFCLLLYILGSFLPMPYDIDYVASNSWGSHKQGEVLETRAIHHTILASSFKVQGD